MSDSPATKTHVISDDRPTAFCFCFARDQWRTIGLTGRVAGLRALPQWDTVVEPLLMDSAAAAVIRGGADESADVSLTSADWVATENSNTILPSQPVIPERFWHHICHQTTDSGKSCRRFSFTHCIRNVMGHCLARSSRIQYLDISNSVIVMNFKMYIFKNLVKFSSLPLYHIVKM